MTGAANIAALAYDRQLGILWGASLANDSLYTINMVTGVATLVGAFNAGHDVVSHGLEFDNSTGTLYMASALAGTFYSVNKSTGQATLLGTHGITSNTSLGYNMNSNAMYAINSDTDSLYSMNVGTGAMTLIGAMAGTILPNSLAFNHDANIMYMTDTSTDSLYTLNLATGAPTLVGSTAVGNLQGLFSDDDYPPGAADNEEQGTTVVRLAIGTNGRVTDCSVTSSSGSRTLDSTTCRILKARARFTPATDSSGNPTAPRGAFAGGSPIVPNATAVVGCTT